MAVGERDEKNTICCYQTKRVNTHNEFIVINEKKRKQTDLRLP